MFRVLKCVLVELHTAMGCVFSGQAEAVELRTTEATIAITPEKESYYNMCEATQITLRLGTKFLTFRLKNAAANIHDGELTVLAEECVEVGEQPGYAAEPAGGIWP